MIRKLLDLTGHGYQPPKIAFAAVEAWLLASLQDGAWPVRVWGGALVASVTTRAAAIKSTDAALDAAVTKSTVPRDGRWNMREATWDKVLASILAARPRTGDLHASAAEGALVNARSPASRVRLVEFTCEVDGASVRGFLGAIVFDDSFVLFDPLTGAYEARPVSDGGEDPFVWFAAHMRRHYGSAAAVTCHTHLVVVNDVYLTWFGPPKAQPGDDGTFTDVKGPIAMARGLTVGGVRPRVKLCCLSQYQAALAQKLRRVAPDVAGRIEVIAVEPQFDRGLRVTDMLHRPDYARIDACVRTILARSIAEGSPRALVNAKNIWAFYVVWAFGGYHLDTGVIMADGRLATDLPVPKAFMTMYQHRGDSSAVAANVVGLPAMYQHVHGTLGDTGLSCVLLPPSAIGNPILLTQPPEMVAFKDTESFANVDVPVLRSGRRTYAANYALRTYIELWFRIRQELKATKRDGTRLLDAETEKGLYRGIVQGAAATGVSHPAPPGARGCGFRAPKVSVDVFETSELGLKKTGDRSHA